MTSKHGGWQRYRQLFLSMLLLFLAAPAFAQRYATWTASSACANCTTVGGNATFTGVNAVPNFTWTATSGVSNRINSVQFTTGADEFPNANPWEPIYGQVTAATSVLRLRHSGNASSVGAPAAAGAQITVTLNFPTETASSGWGLVFFDLDVDQIEILSATDGANNAVPNATIAGWFQSAFDADLANSTPAGSNDPPCWDSANLTIVGSAYRASPCARVVTLGTGVDTGGGSAWFQPTTALRSLTFRYTNLQVTATPSFRLAVAAFPRGVISVLKDAVPNGAQDFTFSTTGADLPGTFSLDDDVDPALSNLFTSTRLVPGTYNITEALVTGWNLSSLNCTDPDGGTTVALAARSASIDLDGDETISCTFVNTQNPLADLVLTKTNTPGINGNADQSADVVVSGGLSVYTITVTNNGPNAANGAVVTDPAPTNLVCSTATCSATGGATCPALTGAPLVAALNGAGVIVPSLPIGGGITIAMNCTVL